LDLNFWTNKPDWYKDADLYGKKVLLWHEYEYKAVEYFLDLPLWHDAQKIFLIGQEADFPPLVNIDPRVYIWDSVLLDKPRCYPFYFWWHQTKEIEKYLGHLNKLTNAQTNNPTYLFEFMIGVDRPHRQFTKKMITDNKLENFFLHNFTGQYIPGSEIELTDAHNRENSSIRYNRHQTANRSTILPYKIYNDSWFSLVHETKTDICFFTEKTAKALYSKRMFVFFGAQHALRDLHRLGYQTFNTVIDESYDCEPDDYVRWQKACDQVKYICQCNPETLYKKVLPILDHNQKQFVSQDWQEKMLKQIKQIAEDIKL